MVMKKRNGDEDKRIGDLAADACSSRPEPEQLGAFAHLQAGENRDIQELGHPVGDDPADPDPRGRAAAIHKR